MTGGLENQSMNFGVEMSRFGDLGSRENSFYC